MKKVIVRLGNGLGNQLFTYASAYSFARRRNAQLYIDNESGFHKKYKYELHNFKISSPIVEKEYKFINFFGRLKRKIYKKFTNLNKNISFLEEELDDDKLTYYKPLEFDFSNILYFEGYFQSEKYFEKHKNKILEEFSFKEHIINESKELANKLRNTNSISIHLRQNKFLKNESKNIEKDNLEHIENSIESIKKGVNYFDKMFTNPTYFVWSNNFDGIEKFFPSKKFILMKENTNKDPAYDLYLISCCKHFILSPSTFHYWGAFLSDYKNKICLEPKDIKNKSGYYGFSNNKDIKPNWWKEI